MKKKLFSIFFCTVILIAGFGHSAVAGDPITLRWAYELPEKDDYRGNIPKWFARELEKQTDGRVKLNVFYGQSLCKAREMAEFIQHGLCDIAWINPSYHRKYGQLSLISSHVGVFQHLSSMQLTKKWIAFYEQFLALNEEYKKTNMIPICQKYLGSFQLFSKKPIKGWNDLKGMKIRAMGKMHQIALSEAGATPMFMSISDTYGALQKNIIQAVLTAFPVGYRVIEVAPKITVLNFNGDPVFAQYCMNLKSFNKLSDADQKTVLRLGKEMAFKYTEEGEKWVEDMIEKWKKNPKIKAELFNIPAEYVEKWNKNEKIKTNTEKWVSQMEKKGYPNVREGMALWKKILNN